MNAIYEIKTNQEFKALAPFFSESLDMLKAKSGANLQSLTMEELVRTLILLTLDKRHGTVLVLMNKNSRPLGYVTLENVTKVFREKTVEIGYLFSNQLCPSTLKELVFEARNWARKNGYVKIQFHLHRASGSGIRLVNTVMGMKQKTLVFTDEL